MSLSDELYKVGPVLIDFDTFNPRGETVDQIINDEEFHKLKESINRIGILVPLIVKKSESSDSKEFILIDGERRLRAALDLKLRTVPIRVVENDTEGRIIAYQIHQNRKAWSKPSEAKSIQSIINSIKAENPDISEVELKKKLIEITSHKITSINDILKILKFDKETQEKASKREVDHSYLIRIEDDFISPLKRVFPEIIDTFSEEGIRKIMVRKVELKLLINTRYMMSANFKEMFKPSLFKEKICLLIIDFIKSPEKSASDLYNEFEKLKSKEESKNQNAGNNEKKNITEDNNTQTGTNTKEHPEEELENDSKKTKEASEKDSNAVNQINGEKGGNNNIPSTNPDRKPIAIPRVKKSGFNAIKESLENIGKQYSEEELEYLKEAIVCLGSEKALKASVLMIWSSSISRILKYIEKDIPKYNTVSEKMHKENKTFYKHYALAFQKNATCIDDIKQLAKDMQLLCYICHEGVITTSQFKQLKGHYDIRNECAHPTSLKLSMNEVLAIFENLIKFIFNNPKLKL